MPMKNNILHTAASRAAGCFLFACLIFLAPLASLAAQAAPAAPAAKGSSTTRIVSEKMTYDANKNQVIFEGKVHVTRPTMEIWSDVLRVILDDSGKKSQPSSNGNTNANALGISGGKVNRIIAERNVRIQQDNKVGTCGKATYYVNDGKIVMEQDPLLVDGDNRIRGRVINYYTESGKSEVIGNVDVQFTTEDNKSPGLPGPESQGAPAGPARGESRR